MDDILKRCEQMIEHLGGKLVTHCKEKETWMINQDHCITEQVLKRVYRFRESYVYVDKIYFPEKPFLVLGFSQEIAGPYEEADPFPADLSFEEMEKEIRYALGIEPYPMWQERAIREGWMPQHATLLFYSGQYAIYNVYEDAFFVDIDSKETYNLGDYYGDPEMALIDAKERFAVVLGDHVGIFDIHNKQFRNLDINIPEWIDSVNLEGRKVEVICEDDKKYTFEI